MTEKQNAEMLEPCPNCDGKAIRLATSMIGAGWQIICQYTKDYMNTPMNWLADAYENAAAVLDTALKTALGGEK